MNEKQARQYAKERAAFTGHPQTLRRQVEHERERFFLSAYTAGDEAREDYFDVIKP
jgi:hypothetical protein